jgi:hypothetical protein
VVFAFEVVWSNSMFTATIQALIPDQVRSRVDSYDMLISIVIMPVGYVVAGPLASSVGITTTLVGAAVVGAVPAALTALVPGNRAVRRTPDGVIVGPEGEIVGPTGEVVGAPGEVVGATGEVVGADAEATGPAATDTDTDTDHRITPAI